MSMANEIRPSPIPMLESSQPMASAPVLARDADATYWMSRYIERAEHVARLLLVNSESLIDVGDVAAPLIERHWKSVTEIMNSEPLANVNDDEPISQQIAAYMVFDEKNPNSLMRCLTRARENARGIREVISVEMWEYLNTLYWSIRSDEIKTLFIESPDQLYQRIIRGSMLFQGLTDQTHLHGQRWYFTQIGKYFERISVTCRILINRYKLASESEIDMDDDTSLGNIHWLAVLRSCASVEMYRRTFLGEMDPQHITQFLLLQSDFPRSVRYCVRESHAAIAAIRAAVRPKSVDPTERILGRLDAQLEYADAGEIMNSGLPAYLNQILESISQAALCVQRSFFFH